MFNFLDGKNIAPEVASVFANQGLMDASHVKKPGRASHNKVAIQRLKIFEETVQARKVKGTPQKIKHENLYEFSYVIKSIKKKHV